MSRIGFKFALSLLVLMCSCCKHIPAGPEGPRKPGKGDDETVYVLDLTSYNNRSSSNRAQMAELWDMMHAVAGLQGLVNRDAERLYVTYVKNEGKNIDEYWWDMYSKPGEWLADRGTVRTKNFFDVIEHFKDYVDGLVVWDPAVPSTSNVASTVAGADNLLPVRWDPSRTSMFTDLRDMGFEVKVWLVNEDGSSKFHDKLEPYEWALTNYLETGKCSARYAAYYIDGYWINHANRAVINHHCVTNHDFFISKKAFFFDLSPWEDEPATDNPAGETGADYRLLCRILRTIYEKNDNGRYFCHIGGFPAWAFKYTRFDGVGGKHGEVDTEWEFARIISAYNAYKDADAISYGAMANGSFWTHFPLDAQYPQEWTTAEELKKKGYLTADGKVDTSKKYFIFYVGDYDSASWLYQMMPSLWDNPARGSVPMMWAISPVLAVRSPMAMHYIRKSASANDYFVAADNGAGYLNPSMLQEPREISGLPSGLDQWAAHSKPFYEKWGLTVSGFIIDGFCPQMNGDCLKCYESFSPNGIVPQKTDALGGMYGNMPILRSGPDINQGNPLEAATNLTTYLKGSHTSFPFYWARAILKSPDWYRQVKARVEAGVSNVEWVDAPTFFELLRMYETEGHDIP
ncbi:MAG: hypothetical protein MJY56_02960 [Bacteroidales bacterium]|nr:hypothetical protein [Bacteroidales bacterium]